MKHTKPLMWTGITATTLIAALFVASLFRQAHYSRNNFNSANAAIWRVKSITLQRGGVVLSNTQFADKSGEYDPNGWLDISPYWGRLTTWQTWVMLPRYVRVSNGSTSTRIQLPLWLPFLATALPTAFLIHHHLRTTRRARAGNCPKCNYNLRGLPPTTLCPECGATPPPREVPR